MKLGTNRMNQPFTSRFGVCFLALAGMGTACSGPAPEPTVVVGSSDDPLRHGDVTEGSTVWITYGLQGGYHIWGSLEAEHIDPADVRMQFGLFVDGVQVGGADYRDDLRRGPDGPFEYGGVTVFIYDDVSVETLEARAVEMTLRLTDGADRQVEDRISLVARCCE